MSENKKSNLADGRDSFDITVGNVLVPFFNRNVTPYPTEVGSPSFELIPIEKQKDVMINVARMHAQQEYTRIMDLVTVLQTQAADIKRRLDLTDMVHAAKYEFQISHGSTYWLVMDHRKNETRLTHNGPGNWSTGVPEGYEYICQIKWLGDYTWIEVKENENGII